VEADWHKLMILQRTMWPFIVHVSEQLDQRFAASRHTTAPITLDLHPVVSKLLVTSRPA